MTSEEFVKGFYLERKLTINSAFSGNNETYVSSLINQLNLDAENNEKLKHLISVLLTDTFYTILLGLDGEASIGHEQHAYKLLDEENNEIAGGEIEGYAYDYFHNNQAEIESSDADFIAILNYRKTEDGGRKTPAHSGYKPSIKFDFAEMQTTGYQKFIERNIVFPGETVEAEIKILGVEYFAGQLKEKMKFEFNEGPYLIGTGIIKHILNNKLRKTSH
ncbi:hypothetical protein [Flavobacterium sp. KACC 22761]|uniref:hypothetical protein n=1 Tax=Flavobacterium sp. KACC 22761 TaxID=3092665 RepID=UPI002A764104|nr:hypothetical protein [Flavobacterium sp. KACC 22761]WPO77076.1 hypothetical protein SCB73_12475 [Flavobacterium sp. KACC 22761]